MDSQCDVSPPVVKPDDAGDQTLPLQDDGGAPSTTINEYTTRTGNTYIEIDGFHFRKDKKHNLKLYWRCIDRDCKVRCVTSFDLKDLLSQPGEHKHDPPPRYDPATDTASLKASQTLTSMLNSADGQWKDRVLDASKNIPSVNHDGSHNKVSENENRIKINGFLFFEVKKRSNYLVWKCIKTKCKVRCITTLDFKKLLSQPAQHWHEPPSSGYLSRKAASNPVHDLSPPSISSTPEPSLFDASLEYSRQSLLNPSYNYNQSDVQSTLNNPHGEPGQSASKAFHESSDPKSKLLAYESLSHQSVLKAMFEQSPHSALNALYNSSDMKSKLVLYHNQSLLKAIYDHEISRQSALNKSHDPSLQSIFNISDTHYPTHMLPAPNTSHNFHAQSTCNSNNAQDNAGHSSLETSNDSSSDAHSNLTTFNDPAQQSTTASDVETPHSITDVSNKPSNPQSASSMSTECSNPSTPKTYPGESRHSASIFTNELSNFHSAFTPTSSNPSRGILKIFGDKTQPFTPTISNDQQPTSNTCNDPSALSTANDSTPDSASSTIPLPPVSIIETLHGNQALQIGDFLYYKRKTNRTHLLWYCSGKECSVQCKTDLDFNLVSSPHPEHEHEPPDIPNEMKKILREDLRRKAASNPDERPVKISCKEIQGFEDVLDNGDLDRLEKS